MRELGHVPSVRIIPENPWDWALFPVASSFALQRQGWISAHRVAKWEERCPRTQVLHPLTLELGREVLAAPLELPSRRPFCIRYLAKGKLNGAATGGGGPKGVIAVPEGGVEVIEQLRKEEKLLLSNRSTRKD
jgi:hypothetical protein